MDSKLLLLFLHWLECTPHIGYVGDKNFKVFQCAYHLKVFELYCYLHTLIVACLGLWQLLKFVHTSLRRVNSHQWCA
jgi:hypothetical protein